MNQIMTQKRNFVAQALPELEHLYCTALHMLGNESEAQDLVQESLAKAYCSWNKYLCDRDRRVWLFRIMVDTLSNKYRPSLKLSAEISDTDEIDKYSLSFRSVDQKPIDESGQVPLAALSEGDFKKALEHLPDDFRLIVVLSLLEDLSCREIAEITGISLETVRAKLHHGRKLMQRDLCEHMAYEGNHSMAADRVRRRRTG